mmetsp:Transcript_30617/g.64129  ORF Transcript_30617/g.64129 Transcript_30617/m.64129 type:complete len:216 (-) Transcript_30617:88-735(-)
MVTVNSSSTGFNAATTLVAHCWNSDTLMRSTVVRKRPRLRCLFLSLLGTTLLDASSNSSPHGCRVGLTRPVILGLGHIVSTVGHLQPAAVLLTSTLHVEFSVILEDSSLGHILLVVGGLLLVVFSTDLLVLGLGQARWNVRAVREGAGLNLLLSTSAVVVGVGDGCPEIQVGDLLEDGLVQLGGLGCLGCRGEGGGRGHGGGDDKDGGGFHCWVD